MKVGEEDGLGTGPPGRVGVEEVTDQLAILAVDARRVGGGEVEVGMEDLLAQGLHLSPALGPHDAGVAEVVEDQA
jgi:hypothetical protein